ncbi:hypothetical protein EN837_28235, partial [bacterium M00.F.Ca.ET.194.01.1.1]
WLLWPSLLSLLALWGGGEADLAQGWTTLLVTVPWLLMAALSLWRWNALRWPLGEAGFQKNLILTGRSADITFGQLQRMVDQLDRIPGVSRSGALDSLNAVAKS